MINVHGYNNSEDSIGLLAVDLGLKTGLAAFGEDGRLRWYRSQHLANNAALRRAAHGVLDGLPELKRLVVEGGGPLAEIWEREAERRGVVVRRVSAELWRALLLPRRVGKKGGGEAKGAAGAKAKRVIEWSGAPRPTSLRHDAAEAILIGFWGVLDAGWLSALPRELAP